MDSAFLRFNFPVDETASEATLGNKEPLFLHIQSRNKVNVRPYFEGVTFQSAVWPYCHVEEDIKPVPGVPFHLVSMSVATVCSTVTASAPVVISWYQTPEGDFRILCDRES